MPDPRDTDLTLSLFPHLGASEVRSANMVTHSVAMWSGYFAHHDVPIGKESAPCFVPALFDTPCPRQDRGVIAMTALVLDVDHSSWNAIQALENKLERLMYFGYSTFNHSGAEPRMRYVLPFERPLVCTGTQWRAAWPVLMEALGLLEYADPKCSNAARVYFLPQRQVRADPRVVSNMRNGFMLVPGDYLPRWPQGTVTERHYQGDVKRSELEPVMASERVLEAATEALERLGPAIQGHGGDQATFKAGAILLNDYSLPESQAMALALEWNKQNEPPWEEEELALKLANGAMYAQKTYGCAREAVELNQEMERIARGS